MNHYYYDNGAKVDSGDVVVLKGITRCYYIVITGNGVGDVLANFGGTGWNTTVCSEELFRQRAIKVGRMPNLYSVLEKAFPF